MDPRASAVTPPSTTLQRYCYRVASAVGLACIHVWGFADDPAPGLAEAAGVALQLTNILRDVVGGRPRGRVYLPHEDTVRVGCTAGNRLKCDGMIRRPHAA